MNKFKWFALPLLLASCLLLWPGPSGKQIANAREFNWANTLGTRLEAHPGPIIPSGPKVPPKVKRPLSVVPNASNRFVWGNCTWHVANKMKITFFGDAKDWLSNAKAAGYETGEIPMVGSAVQLKTAHKLGHVAFVEKVEGDKVVISAKNEQGLNVLTIRTIALNDPSILGFIYPK